MNTPDQIFLSPLFGFCNFWFSFSGVCNVCHLLLLLPLVIRMSVRSRSWTDSRRRRFALIPLWLGAFAVFCLGCGLVAFQVDWSIQTMRVASEPSCYEMLPAVISLGNANVMFLGQAVIAFAHFAVFLSMWRKTSRDSGRGAPGAVSDPAEVRFEDSTGIRKPKTPGPANGGRIWKTLLPALVLALALACPACRRHATVKNLPKDMVQVCRAFRDAPVGPERETAAETIRSLFANWKLDPPWRSFSVWAFLDVLGSPDEGTESEGETFLRFRERDRFSFSYQVTPADGTGPFRALRFFCSRPDRVYMVDLASEVVRERGHIAPGDQKGNSLPEGDEAPL